jgi:soluble lytic murein transglycosylase-like protein
MDLYDENEYSALAAYNAGPSGYNQGAGIQYAEDTLRRVGLLEKYIQDQQLAEGY